MSATTPRKPHLPPVTFLPHWEPTHAQIALCARAIWQAEGHPQDRDVEHWLQAEAQLRQAGKADAHAATSAQSRTVPSAPRSNA